MRSFSYTEPLNYSELAFLKKKEADERKLYYKIYRIFMIASFILPFAGAWYQAADGVEHAFSPLRYFFLTGILLGICSFALYISYLHNLRKIQKDIKHQTKTILATRITKKTFVATKNAHYFYIDAVGKLSIEVAESDYNTLNEGDELNIEYSTYSKEYLGYF